jgi:hypothetical protein
MYSHSILSKWGIHFFQLLNVPGVTDVRKTEIHTTEPLVPEPSASEFVMTIEEVKRNQSPGTDQISAEMISAGSRTICSEFHELINSIWNEEELPEKWKELITVPLYKKGDKTDCIIEAYHFCQLCTTFYPTSCCQSRLLMQRELLGGSSMWISTQEVSY